MQWPLVLLLTLAQLGAPAEQPPQQPTATTGAGVQDAVELALLPGIRADLEIHALVHADELTFREAPDVQVTFAGEPQRSTVDRSERENLPEKVEPGVTYRDVWLRLTISSTFVIPGITAPEEGTTASPDAALETSAAEPPPREEPP